VCVCTPRIIVGVDAQALPSVDGGGAVARKESAAVVRCQSQLPLHAWHDHLSAKSGALDDVQTPQRLRHVGDEAGMCGLVDVENAAVGHAQRLEILGQPCGPTATRQIKIEIEFIQATYRGQARFQRGEYSVESHQQHAVSLEREPVSAHIDLGIEPAMGSSGRCSELRK